MHRHTIDSTTAAASPSTLDLGQLGRGVLLGIACFALCSPLLFSVNPLPLALLCAAEGGLGWLWVGTLLGIWQQNTGVGGWYVAATLCGVGLRLFLRAGTEPGGFRQAVRRLLAKGMALLRGETNRRDRSANMETAEPLSRRVLISLFAALIPALGIPLSRGLVFYDLYGAVFYLVLTPPLTALFAFSFPFEGKYTSDHRSPTKACMGLVSEVLILSAVCFCGRHWRFGDLLLAMVFAVFVCLEMARRRGLGMGVIVAVACGAALDMTLLPVLLGVTLIYALLREVVGNFSLLVALLGGAIYLFLLLDSATLWPTLTSLAAGGILFSGRCRLSERIRSDTKTEQTNHTCASAVPAELTVAQANQKHLTDRISTLSGAFSSLAETFRTPEERRFPLSGESRTSAPLMFHGSKAGEQFATYFDGISHLLRDVLHRAKEAEETYREEESQNIFRYLKEQKMAARWCVVSGREKRWIRIGGLSPATLTVPTEQFCQDIGRILGAEVSKPLYEGGEESVLRLYTLPLWQVSFRYQSMAAPSSAHESPTLCGDTIRAFETADGRFCALLCDGMGHGREAAITSGTCALFLERTLRAGVEIPTALGILNQYLLARAQAPECETSSTVDLFWLDRYTGRGELVKCGAAPSLLFRGGGATHLFAHTFPIGILSGVDAQVIPLELSEGEALMMMSDGVHDGEEPTEERILQTIGRSQADNDAATVRAVLQDARTRGTQDDASVLWIRIGRRTSKDKQN